MKRMKAIALLIFSLAACLGLFGCAKDAGVSVHMDFLALVAERDFAGAYELVSSAAKQKITAEAFVKRYEIMFSELSVDSIAVDAVEFREGEKPRTAAVGFDLHYILPDDELTFPGCEMPLVMEGERWYVDWSPALIAKDMTWGDTLRVVRIPAKRGEIFAGEDILAKNVPALTVFAATEKIGPVDSFCAAVAPLINKSEEFVKNKLRKAGDICIIFSALPEEFGNETLNALLEIPGVGIDTKSFSTIRVYPFGKTLFHTLGYVGAIADKEELDKLNAGDPGRYTADSQVGKSGLELAYESELRGMDGREYYIADANNKKKSTLYIRASKDGLDLHMTIDVGLQQRLEEVMVYSLTDEQTGAAIAMNPKTGAIKALCSFPGFDPNAFVRGMSDASFQQIQNDKSLPLFNRLTLGMYPPGSIIKPFTAAAALETGAITVNTVFKGKIEDDRWTPVINDRPWYYPPIKRVAWRSRPVPLNLQNAMITSDNIFFAFMAMEAQKEPFLNYLDKLGMNTPIPFDLPIRKPHVYNEGTDFDIKLLADSGYGQGEILITPIQMAAMFTALQDGNIMVPRVVESLYATNGNDYLMEEELGPKVWIENALQPETVRTLEPMLEKVMTEGTGHALGMRSRSLAGKTGTAQVGNREVSWLAVYTLDRDEPLLAITVIDTNGGMVKFDIVREILQYRGTR